MTVDEDSPATAIGIAAPTDPSYAASQLSVTIDSLPGDGIVALADGTAVAAGQALTTDQLSGLTFTPTRGQAATSSTLTYTVTDPADASRGGHCDACNRCGRRRGDAGRCDGDGQRTWRADRFALTTSQTVVVMPGAGGVVPYLTLSDGGTAAYAGTDGSGRLLFSTTVAAGQSAADLQITGLVANGASFSAPGGLAFQPTVTYAAGASPIDLVAAAVQSNGQPQLVVADLNGGLAALPVAPGGSLGSATTVMAGSHPGALAAADVDDDGKTDFLVADRDGQVTEVLNSGSTMTYAMGAGLTDVVAADLNGDGYADMIVTSAAGVSVRPGEGGGLFGAVATYAAGASPWAVATADLNGDGRTDVVVADLSGGVSVLYGDGSGGLGDPVSYNAGASPIGVATADLNGDGRPDLIVADANGGVSVLLGKAGGGFAAATSYAAGPHPYAVTTADLNGDGKLDLVVTDKTGGVYVLLGNGSGGFGAATEYAAGVDPRGMVVTDLDGDGKPDIAVADLGGGVSVLLNSSNAPSTFPSGSVVTAPGADTGLAVDTSPADDVWVGPATGDWSDGSDWQNQNDGTTGTAPGASDSATFFATNTIDGTGASQALVVDTDAALTLDGRFTAGAVTLNGTITDAGAIDGSRLTIEGAGLTTGVVDATGVVIVENGATFADAGNFTLESGGYNPYIPPPVYYTAFVLDVEGAGSRATIGGTLGMTGSSFVQVTDGGYLQAARAVLQDPVDYGELVNFLYSVDAALTFEIGTAGGAATGTVTVDAGATLALTTNAAIAAPAFVDNGTIILGQSTDLQTAAYATAPVSGSGTLELAGTDYDARLTASTLTLDLVGSDDTVVIGLAAAASNPTVIEFDASDKLSTSGITSASWAANVLTLYGGLQVAGSLNLVGDYSADGFSVIDQSGTDVITLVPGGTGSSTVYLWRGAFDNAVGSWSAPENWVDPANNQVRSTPRRSTMMFSLAIRPAATCPLRWAL